MSDFTFRDRIQAEVDDLQRRIGVGKRIPIGISEKVPMVSSAKIVREEALFKARQEVELAEKRKLQVETEYRELKEKIEEINLGLEPTRQEIMDLRKKAEQVVSDVRSKVWLPKDKDLSDNTKKFSVLIPEIKEIFFSKIKFPRIYPDEIREMWFYNLRGNVDTLEDHARLAALVQYERKLYSNYQSLCNEFRKLSNEITEFSLLVDLDEESLEDLTTRLLSFISTMDEVRTLWLTKKQELFSLEQDQPGAEDYFSSLYIGDDIL